MVKQYSPLLGLTIKHSYYRDGLSRDFRLSPSPVTAAVLSKLDIRTSANASGLELYWGYEMQDDIARGALKAHTEDLVLTFLLESTNPIFFNFTDLTFPQSAQHKYYYQAHYSASDDPTPTILEGHEVEMFPTPGVLSFTPPDGAVDLEAELVNLAGQPLGADTITKNDSGKVQYPIVLSAADDWGQYRIKCTDLATATSTASDVVHILPDQFLMRCFGLVQIIIPAAEIRLLSPPSASSLAENYPQFAIEFDKRSTYWRYNIINRNNLAFDRLQLIADGQEVGVRSMREKELADGSKATELTLQHMLPLEEVPTTKIKLRLLQDTPAGETKALHEVSLPVPDAHRIYPERSGGDLIIYSDIFIYL